jgi:hypothetical protein
LNGFLSIKEWKWVEEEALEIKKPEIRDRVFHNENNTKPWVTATPCFKSVVLKVWTPGPASSNSSTLEIIRKTNGGNRPHLVNQKLW